jgi:hypothetical protein
MDIEGTEAKNDWAGEDQQQINQSTDQIRKSLCGVDYLHTLQFKKQQKQRQD